MRRRFTVSTEVVRPSIQHVMECGTVLITQMKPTCTRDATPRKVDKPKIPCSLLAQTMGHHPGKREAKKFWEMIADFVLLFGKWRLFSVFTCLAILQRITILHLGFKLYHFFSGGGWWWLLHSYALSLLAFLSCTGLISQGHGFSDAPD